MEPETSQLIELLEKRLRDLKSLAQEIQAAQQACVSADLEALRTHDCIKERLCAGIRCLDHKIRELVQSANPTESFRGALEAFTLRKSPQNPATTRRLRALLDESEAARVEVSKLNEIYVLFLARARSAHNVMINVLSHHMGIYPPLQASAFRNSTFERSY